MRGRGQDACVHERPHEQDETRRVAAGIGDACGFANPRALTGRVIPREETNTFGGTSQKQLAYARLYFLQGIKDVLEYVAEDTMASCARAARCIPPCRIT